MCGNGVAGSPLNVNLHVSIVEFAHNFAFELVGLQMSGFGFQTWQFREEFIDGILRCKGPARAIDQVAARYLKPVVG